MQFIDRIDIVVRSGDGGPGKVSFMRARNKPKLGPDGGDGGFGGSVYLVANNQLNTLSALRYHRMYKAENGERGGPNGCTGADGEDLRIEVPLGTAAFDRITGSLIGEVVNPEDEIMIAEGGKRGLGNLRFTSSTNRTPQESTPGGKGVEVELRLELKLLADVGFAGYPNAGKSTLLSRLSSARPKIADYPFTTLTPQLGVVDFAAEGDVTGKSFVACDVPGLIEGAHEGKGLGLEFLRHLERTKMIAFIIDGCSDDAIEPITALRHLRHELQSYSEALFQKPFVVVLNKVDLLPERDSESGEFWSEEDKSKYEQFYKTIAEFESDNIAVFAISAMKSQDLTALKYALWDRLSVMKQNPDAHSPVVARLGRDLHRDLRDFSVAAYLQEKNSPAQQGQVAVL